MMPVQTPARSPHQTPLRLLVAVAAAALWAAPAAFAQNSYDIMVEEGGRPLKRAPKPDIPQADPSQKPKKQPRSVPRGSSGYVAPTPLPRTGSVMDVPSPGVYTPPPINTFSDRVRNCIHSYPLNAGIGNNPTDQSMYIRQCAN